MSKMIEEMISSVLAKAVPPEIAAMLTAENMQKIQQTVLEYLQAQATFQTNATGALIALHEKIDALTATVEELKNVGSIDGSNRDAGGSDSGSGGKRRTRKPADDVSGSGSGGGVD